MNPSRRILLVIIACAALIQMGGSWSISFLLRRMHKTEMHARIRNGAKGVLIRLSEQEFQDTKIEGDEIQIGDQFYDIIKVTRNGNQLQIEALHDSKENILKDIQNTGRGKNMLLHIAKIFTPLYHPEPTLNLNFQGFDSHIKHCEMLSGHSSQYHPQDTVAPPDDIL